MQSLKKIALNLFHPFQDLIQAWEEKFANYRCITDKDIPALLQKYEVWSRDVLEVMYLGDTNMTLLKTKLMVFYYYCILFCFYNSE